MSSDHPIVGLVCIAAVVLLFVFSVFMTKWAEKDDD